MKAVAPPVLADVRKDFPLLSRKVHNKPLLYFDNAATSQKPQVVIDALNRYYSYYNSNIHRGVYQLSEEASEGYEGARAWISHYLNASSPDEVIFVRGATEGINLIANSYGTAYIKEDNEILITAMEHHANIVPWQQLTERIGAKLVVAPVEADGTLDLDRFKSCISAKTALAALVHSSNSIGTRNPIREMVSLCKEVGATVLVDGCQAVPHGAVDVIKLGCDFFVFSGHKACGPTGTGVLWGRKELLEKMPPWQSGGDMIKHVSFQKTTYADPPQRFEAGTPHIAGAIGLKVALQYLQELGWEAIQEQEALLAQAFEHLVLKEVEGLQLVGSAQNRLPIFSMVADGAHPA